MIALTIGAGPYAPLAARAAEALARRTGLRAVVLGDESLARRRPAHPHFLKFHLFDELDRLGLGGDARERRTTCLTSTPTSCRWPTGTPWRSPALRETAVTGSSPCATA